MQGLGSKAIPGRLIGQTLINCDFGTDSAAH